MKVLGMGNALVDVLALIEDDSTLEKMQLPKGSMQLIDEEKMKALSVAIEDVEKFLASGGSASNTITSLGKLGIDTGFLGKVGTDYYGGYYKDDLLKYGVKSHLTIVDDQPSGVATTFISKDGERTFGTFLGAAATLLAEDLKEEVFAKYDYFYIEGYLVQNLDLIRRALSLAKSQGLKVALDLASYNVVEDNKAFLAEIIPQYVDILFANEEEAKALKDLSPEETLDVLSKDVEIVVVKVGADGSWIKKGDEKVFVPTLVKGRVDTTGAGDLYAAGFLYGLIKNRSLKECGECGTLLAEQVIQVVGAKMDEERWSEIKKAVN